MILSSGGAAMSDHRRRNDGLSRLGKFNAVNIVISTPAQGDQIGRKFVYFQTKIPKWLHFAG
jgi:hypothetical protein